MFYSELLTVYLEEGACILLDYFNSFSSSFKGDQGGLRTLQKKWTSYLKARLLCSVPDKNLFFNIVNDIFILKSPNPKESVIYGVFSPQL